ncbi:hypothetical protein SAVG_00360 [Staphylococcus aureus subsp. aureus M1015]|uniref:Uncharacterized protein n=1 Tax=Staphylococcus aureus subsp. aureus MN8 TaxID=548470 RepID=A0A0E1XB60_STAAU|nr:hypothetical protein HMPREF0772_10666 [Staphylococcus aureus subsp. aureus TCH60]EEV10387.1 predicted protein [Staphylococcus aureus subsp. aureus 68-397]EEV12978.1 predicted protein [Staphylococcus aureus subsp. aureus E1410]EEV15639.1 predicted protein [Staphylococcus aureus subsp. aureus M876]EFB43246.1 predicted protein [Staphylococcus aureus subsp. aureus C101]EFC01852.1 hypothetical protein SFAG_00363 [Staphylococcus aureus subsp. aureus C160]EFC27714.1 hypothetical protein SHAG_0030
MPIGIHLRGRKVFKIMNCFILYICIKIDLIKIRFILSSIQMILVRLFYYGIIA